MADNHEPLTIEQKRNWLRRQMGWRINVDALSDSEVRYVYSHEMMHKLLLGDEASEGLGVSTTMTRRPFAVPRSFPKAKQRLGPPHEYDPEMITVIFEEPDDG